MVVFVVHNSIEKLFPDKIILLLLYYSNEIVSYYSSVILSWKCETNQNKKNKQIAFVFFILGWKITCIFLN